MKPRAIELHSGICLALLLLCSPTATFAETVPSADRAKPETPAPSLLKILRAHKLKAKVDAVVEAQRPKHWQVGLVVGVITPDQPQGAIYYYGNRSLGKEHPAPTGPTTAF